VKRVVALVPVVALLIGGCSASGGGGNNSASPTPSSGAYSAAQVAAYKAALTAQAKNLQLASGMTLDTNISDEKWAPYISKAEDFCGQARTTSWDAAGTAYLETLRSQVGQQMASSSAAPTFSNEENQMLVSLANVQLQAVAAPGSLCPELAPAGFAVSASASPSASSSPAVPGQVYGKGCQGVGNALTDLAALLKSISAGTASQATLNDDLKKISAGLEYASQNGASKEAGPEIKAEVAALGQMAAAFKAQDVAGFSKASQAASGNALALFKACQLK
jgi:hypothetical protein